MTDDQIKRLLELQKRFDAGEISKEMFDLGVAAIRGADKSNADSSQTSPKPDTHNKRNNIIAIIVAMVALMSMGLFLLLHSKVKEEPMDSDESTMLINAEKKNNVEFEGIPLVETYTEMKGLLEKQGFTYIGEGAEEGPDMDYPFSIYKGTVLETPNVEIKVFEKFSVSEDYVVSFDGRLDRVELFTQNEKVFRKWTEILESEKGQGTQDVYGGVNWIFDNGKIVSYWGADAWVEGKVGRITFEIND